MGLVLMTTFLSRNILSLSQERIQQSIDVVIACLQNENLEVSETSAKLLSGLLRSSQRHRILPLRVRPRMFSVNPANGAQVFVGSVRRRSPTG